MQIEYRHVTDPPQLQDWRVVLRTVFRGGGPGRHLALFRVSFEYPNRKPGDGWLYKQISVGLAPRVWSWGVEPGSWRLCVAGLRLRGSTVFGGRLAD